MSKTTEASSQSTSRSAKRSRGLRRSSMKSESSRPLELDEQLAINKHIQVAKERATWVPPKPQAWPKVKGWSSNQIVKATLEFDALVADLAAVKMPKFDAVELVRAERSKNDCE
ncbi:MAG: hypothetical protein WCT04_10905 [Planctomycetota bacterium]